MWRKLNQSDAGIWFLFPMLIILLVVIKDGHMYLDMVNISIALGKCYFVTNKTSHNLFDLLWMIMMKSFALLYNKNINLV